MSDWAHPTMSGTEKVRCRCSRLVPPSKMYEVRSLGVGTDYLCSACVEDHYRKGSFDRITFYRRGGASDEWLAGHAEKLAQGPLLRSGLPQEIWGHILAGHLDEAEPVENRWE